MLGQGDDYYPAVVLECGACAVYLRLEGRFCGVEHLKATEEYREKAGAR